MLGFAFMNPSVVVTCQDYKKFTSIVVEDASAIGEARKFIERTTADTRRRALWIVGTELLTRCTQEWPNHELDNIIIGVFDVGDKLSKVPGIKVVDAEMVTLPSTEPEHPSTFWRLRRCDLEHVMHAAIGGFNPQPSDEPKENVEPKPRSPKPKKRKAAPDSLAGIFGPLLDKIESEKKRSKAASMLAAFVEGVYSDEEWAACAQKIETYGVATELLQGAVRAFRAGGKLTATRGAVQLIVEGVDPLKAAARTNASADDLGWLDEHWSFTNLAPRPSTAEAVASST